MTDNIDEKQKENRKKNVILFPAPESRRNELNQRKRTKVSVIRVSGCFESERRKRGKNIRHGKEREGNVRQVVVEVNDVGVKWKLV